MGQAKKRMMEDQQERDDVQLAAKLKITVDELHECDYQFEDDTSNDGLVYSNYIVFNKENTPKHILKKIGVDSLGRFELDNNSDE